MDEMNQSAPMSQPAATPAAAPADTKKTSMSMILILVVVAAVVALLILSKSKTVDEGFVETAGYVPAITGEVAEVTNTSDELADIEADINSLNLDDIDAGL